MYSSLVTLFLLGLYLNNVNPAKVKPTELKNVKDSGDPLFLTPLIENNQTDEARRKAEVTSDIFNMVKSYSGYFTVDRQSDSNLFFWFFPAEEDYEDAPVLLWLLGRPGSSSLYSIFKENGPFILKSELELNPHTWTKSHSVIYIDNPVQAGYSFTNDGFANDETKVGEDLYQALQQFFTLFPELQTNDFFIAGEWYGGKHVPAASYTILRKNPTASLKINLKGMAIGNGFCDPPNQYYYIDYLNQIGMLDTHGVGRIQLYNDFIYRAMKFGKVCGDAFQIFDKMTNGDLCGGDSIFLEVTDYSFFHNYVLYTEDPESNSEYMNYSEFLQTSEVREAIHVGDLVYHKDLQAEEHLHEDLMKSVTPQISILLSNIRVLFYNGQLDMLVPYTHTVNFLKKLNFDAAGEYQTAIRHKWYVGDELAGYIKQAGNLTEVVVRNAGHMVPADQPEAALELITKFTRNQITYN